MRNDKSQLMQIDLVLLLLHQISRRYPTECGGVEDKKGRKGQVCLRGELVENRVFPADESEPCAWSWKGISKACMRHLLVLQ